MGAAVEAFTALADRDDTDEARRVVDGVRTEDLLTLERYAIRLIWICREVRGTREPKK